MKTAKEILQLLIDQYNSQNDTTVPSELVKYDYELTHEQFLVIEIVLKEAIARN